MRTARVLIKKRSLANTAFAMVVRCVGGRPPLQWFPALLAASRLTWGHPHCWRRPALHGWHPAFTTILHAVGGFPPLRWSPALMAAPRLCNCLPLCWRPSAVTMVSFVVECVPPCLGSPALLAASRLTSRKHLAAKLHV